MRTILVIDDESIVRLSCERSLGAEGFEVKTAEGGRQGLAFLEQGSFDLVLLDIKMPDIDGIEVLKKIKSTWPETKVIMITGYSSVDTAVKTLRLGALNYLEKPFTPDSLLTMVKEALS